VLANDRELKAVTSSDRTDFRIRGARGLQLRVTAKGTRSWAFAYKSPATGKWAKFAIGKYPDIGLAEAKQRAEELSVQIRKGYDPIHDRRQQAVLETFDDLARRYMREHSARNARAGRPSRSTEDAQRILDRDILPTLGRILAENVTRQHVMQVVETIADRGALVSADRALGLIRAIYNWACGTGRMDRNPTFGLKKRNAARAKDRVLSPDEIRTFWTVAERLQDMSLAIRDALRLQLLTGARISEVLEAARSELDFDRGLWTIPAIRTKSGREHVLPLSPMSASIFRTAIARGDEQARRRSKRSNTPLEQPTFVFPPQRSVSSFRRRTKPRARQRRTPDAFDPHAATRCLVRCRETFRENGIVEPFNTHDLRRTLATQLGEMDVPDEIIERILNHAPRTGAGKHYNHAKYLRQMRRALENWAERLEAIISERQSSKVRANEAVESRL